MRLDDNKQDRCDPDDNVIETANKHFTSAHKGDLATERPRFAVACACAVQGGGDRPEQRESRLERRWQYSSTDKEEFATPVKDFRNFLMRGDVIHGAGTPSDSLDGEVKLKSGELFSSGCHRTRCRGRSARAEA